MNMKEKIIDYCKSLGLDTIGFTKCRVFEELTPMYQYRIDNNLINEFEERDIEKRINPFLHFSEGKTIISIAFPYYSDTDYKLGKGFSIYTMGQDYHCVVNQYLSKICEFIMENGGVCKAFVDSNPLPERYIAYLCNLGFIGKNNMLITKKYGSFVFLGEIIMDLPLDIQEENNRAYDKMIKYEECGSCENCLKKCPTKAINMHKKNPNICLSYITQKKDLEDKFFNLMGQRLFGCDTCQFACPYNKDVSTSPIKEFKPLEHMVNVDIEELMNIDNAIFKEKYKLTSCGWRGKNILQRNALIYVTNSGHKITDLKEIKSPYIKDYYNRLLKQQEL
ncbi:tRNA epoxyqueuosine(34) reductase QueG [Clostridium sp. 19966]|uniref:tRNA epoxyqueuosine(34) reductase QueG n=1 Tax=Clostridium sp. 19966 TaxID=2768166 RepID=UPI0028E09E6A|nr:tRNA epoxyqueuosine(34) reductase QueG [Clostridium sp. 19966]MDT8718513.1 tRNA epoxyqueuosine(34) reductase QueG [Clostridium sp. 19966]